MILFRGNGLRIPTCINRRGIPIHCPCVQGFFIQIGVWRSWLARTAGGREVAGSSPVTPTSTCLFYPVPARAGVSGQMQLNWLSAGLLIGDRRFIRTYRNAR